VSKTLIAFIGVCLVGGAGADYVNQTFRAGLGLGALSPGAYFETVTGRINEFQAQRAADAARSAMLAVEPRSLLPAPPLGWERRDATKDDQFVLNQGSDDPVENLPPELQQDPTMLALIKAQAEEDARRDARQLWVYQRPGALISVRLITRNGQQDGGGFGMQATALKMVKANIDMMSNESGFGIIKGVPYFEMESFFTQTDSPIRVITARMGEEVSIAAKGMGSDEDFVALLSAIDYDQLNTMLAKPLANIGSGAKDIPLEEQKVLAERAAIANRASVYLEGAMAELSLRRAGLEITRGSAKMSELDHKMAEAKLDDSEKRIRARYDEMMLEANPPATAATTEAATADAVETAAGGIPTVADTADAEQKAAKPVVRKMGDGCQLRGAIKFCTLGD
jgi:hypothetical protein